MARAFGAGKVIRPVAILGGKRIPFCRIGTDYLDQSLLQMMLASFEATVQHFSLNNQILGDVALGTTFYHPEFWNLSREVVLRSSLNPETPGMGIQRACATSLDATIAVAQKIALGQIDVAIAGGVESVSNTAFFLRPELARRLVQSSRARKLSERLAIWQGIRPHDFWPQTPPATEPTTGKSMGEHCEIMAQEWKITREEQDELALASHQNGVRAYERGFYRDLIVPFQGIERDNNLRVDTNIEKLAKLKPSFDFTGKGTLTAGNSSPLTDGSASVLLSSEEWAKAHGIPILAYLTDFETAAIDVKTEGLLMAPAYAVPRLLKRHNLHLQDFDFYEIHEAFAAQVLCTLRAWENESFCRRKLNLTEPFGEISRQRLNVVGGSVALGHPFGATGARMVASMGKLLSEKSSGRGLLSICTGGGMGTVALMER